MLAINDINRATESGCKLDNKAWRHTHPRIRASTVNTLCVPPHTDFIKVKGYHYQNNFYAMWLTTNKCLVRLDRLILVSLVTVTSIMLRSLAWPVPAEAKEREEDVTRTLL